MNDNRSKNSGNERNNRYRRGQNQQKDRTKPEEMKKPVSVSSKLQQSETMRIERQGKDGDFLLTIEIFDKNGFPKQGVIVRVMDLDSSSFHDLQPTNGFGVIQHQIKFDCEMKKFKIVALGTAIAPRTKTFWNHTSESETVSQSCKGELVQIRTKKILAKITTITYRSKES